MAKDNEDCPHCYHSEALSQSMVDESNPNQVPKIEVKHAAEYCLSS